jgi:capsular exopolysaccharide synthesis family protein
MEVNQSNTKDLGSLTIKDLFFKYIRFLPVFLVSIALCLLAAYLYLRYTTPIYRVSGTLTFKSDNSPRGDRFDAIMMAKNISDIQTEIEILKSRPLMERVVDTARLQTNYVAVGKIKSLNIYKNSPFDLEALKINDSTRSFTLNLIFNEDNQFRINKEKTLFKSGDIIRNVYGDFRLTLYPGGSLGKEYNVTWNPTVLQAGAFAPMIRVSPKIVGSNIYNISIDIPTPRLGIDIINNLMNQYLTASIEDKNRTITQTLENINLQLGRLKIELDSIESRLVAFKKRNNITDIDKQTEDFISSIRDADKAVIDTRVKLRKVDLLEEYLKDAAYDFDKVPSSFDIDNTTLTQQVEGYNRLQAERKLILERNVPAAHPGVQAKNEEIEKTRQSILVVLVNLRDAYNKDIDDFYKRKGIALSEVEEMPEKAQQLLEIERERDITQDLFKFLMEKKAETEISQASTISNSKILDKAYSSGSPIKPNRRGIQLLAIILGIGLPAMFIFFLEIVNDKVNTRYDIEKITDASILGEVGHSYSSSSMVVSKTNRSMVSEQFRIIRSNLQYVLNKIDKPVIMVTSSFSAEGKSFITTNLGGVMALAGRKTVILEFDIRKPKLFSGLKLVHRNGITNFLVSKSSLEELPIKIPGFDNLYAISCGPVPPNPSELLLDSRVADLFAWLKEKFEVIILDTAPVGMVSDAMTLGKFADSTLYIVRQGHTYKKQVALIDELYRENRLPKISIIVNDVKLKPGYGYYGYGRYGYGYGYGGGYYEMEEKKESAYKKFFSLSRIKKLAGKK